MQAGENAGRVQNPASVSQLVHLMQKITDYFEENQRYNFLSARNKGRQGKTLAGFKTLPALVD